MKKVKKKYKISKFEKLIYSLAVFLLVISPISIVFSKATLSEINFEVDSKDEHLQENLKNNIMCPKCGNSQLNKNGKMNSRQRYICKKCRRNFYKRN